MEFKNNHRSISVFEKKELRKSLVALRKQKSDERLTYLAEWLHTVLRQENVRASGAPSSRDVVVQSFRDCLKKAGLHKGLIAEIGGPYNSDAEQFPEFEFEWLSLYPSKDRPEVICCNICEADHIPDERYDAIFSVSVMEHVSDPKDAARHMMRILKPGGLIFHSAPFSYFYHGAPADFWRYTPDGFEALFPRLKPMLGEFYAGARRRDNRGSSRNRVDRDGGAAFAPDAFGGWRENWTTLYCGQKSAEYEKELLDRTRKQIIVDLMHLHCNQGLPRSKAARIVVDGLRRMHIGSDLRLHLIREGRGIVVNPAECTDLYRNNSRNGFRVSYNAGPVYERFNYLLSGTANPIKKQRLSDISSARPFVQARTDTWQIKGWRFARDKARKLPDPVKKVLRRFAD